MREIERLSVVEEFTATMYAYMTRGGTKYRYGDIVALLFMLRESITRPPMSIYFFIR